MIRDITYLVRPGSLCFKTFCFEFSGIGVTGIVTQYTRISHRNQHVVVPLQITFQRSGETSVEHPEVQPHIVVVDSFPLT